MATPDVSPPQDGGGNMLTQKLGPLSVWVWLLIATVALLAYYLYSKHKSGSTPTAAAATTGTNSVPDYIVQNYLGNTPSGSPPPGAIPPASTSTQSWSTPTSAPRVESVPPRPAPPVRVTPAPAPAPAPKPAAQQYTTVTVVPFADPAPWNSTLWGIATHYGVSGGYQALAALNGIKNPNLIYPGEKIRVPIS